MASSGALYVTAVAEGAGAAVGAIVAEGATVTLGAAEGLAVTPPVTVAPRQAIEVRARTTMLKTTRGLVRMLRLLRGPSPVSVFGQAMLLKQYSRNRSRGRLPGAGLTGLHWVEPGGQARLRPPRASRSKACKHSVRFAPYSGVWLLTCTSHEVARCVTCAEASLGCWPAWSAACCSD